LELSSPIYRLGINMVGRLFAQDAALYADIMLSTEERRRAIARLADTFSKLAHVVQEQDRSQLIDRFAATTQAFGAQETDRALRESDRLINALCVMLAAERQQAIDA
jgi:prephenate dehydrogenase